MGNFSSSRQTRSCNIKHHLQLEHHQQADRESSRNKPGFYPCHHPLLFPYGSMKLIFCLLINFLFITFDLLFLKTKRITDVSLVSFQLLWLFFLVFLKIIKKFNPQFQSNVTKNETEIILVSLTDLYLSWLFSCLAYFHFVINTCLANMLRQTILLSIEIKEYIERSIISLLKYLSLPSNILH